MNKFLEDNVGYFHHNAAVNVIDDFTMAEECK